MQVTAKIISSHDVLTDDPRLRQEALQVDDRNSRVSATEEETSDEELEERARKRSQAPSPPPRGTIKKGRLGTPDDMSSDSVMAPLPSEVRLCVQLL